MRTRMASLLLAAGLCACSGKESPSADFAAAPPTSASPQSASQSGIIQQIVPAGGYTYAEVKTRAGPTVWMAGGPLPLKVGDRLEWGNYAVMRNFRSKALERSFDTILFVQSWGAPGGQTSQVAPHGAYPTTNMATAVPAQTAHSGIEGLRNGQGQVKKVALAGGYTYLEVLPPHSQQTLWLAAPQASVQVGETVAWSGGAIMTHFVANALGRSFDEILFVGTITPLHP